MLRWLIRALAIGVIAVATLVVLDFAELLVPVRPDDSPAMATTIPGCNGRVLAQGLTYRWSDPKPGDVVAVHAAVASDGSVIPDEDADDRTLVLNPQVNRLEWIRGGRQRRVCQAVAVEIDGRRLTVANLHATNNSDLARVEVGLAADFVRDAETCILCGDFNVPAFAVPEFSPPIEGIDQILVRGLEFQ